MLQLQVQPLLAAVRWCRRRRWLRRWQPSRLPVVAAFLQRGTRFCLHLARLVAALGASIVVALLQPLA